MNRKETNPQTTFDIYVGNVPKNITDTELKQLFIKYGEVKQVLCRWKEEHATIGYAIVKFVFKADADKLLQETNEILWNGHPLPIKAARRSDQNQHNGNQSSENKSNYYPDFNSKPLFMNPPFLKGGSAPRMFCPIPPPYPSKPVKRHANDFHFMSDVYFPNSNCHENQNVHSVPLNLEVLCTNVEDAVTFYGCPVHRFDELIKISQALTNLNLAPNKVDKKPFSKRVYAGLFSEDHSWYRCIVTRTSIPNKPCMCSVSYIDYGNQEEIPYKNLVELPESLQKVPAFASKFIFSNLMCESKSNKQTYLHQLTNKRMSLCAILSPVSSEYSVLKCSCNGKDVISETVKKGFASFKKATPKSGTSKSPSSITKTSHKLNNENVENCKSKTLVCNGVNGHSIEMGENGLATEGGNNIKLARKLVTKGKDNSKTEIKREEIAMNDTSEYIDFHPKIIIKRGSDLSHIVGSKEPAEDKKEKEIIKQNSSSTMDSVISNLKLINNIRTLVSQSSDDSIIQRAVELLQNENSFLEIPESQVVCTNEAYEKYNQSMNEIRKCKDRTKLPNLREQRDLLRNELCEKLKELLKSFNSSILERKNNILQTIMDLASNSNDWMNVELKSKPSSLKELVAEYNKVKENKWNLVQRARDKTNEKHRQFMEIFKNLEKEFYLNSFDKDNFKCDFLNISNETKRTSPSLKFEEALKDLGEAVDEEIRTLTLNKGKDSVSIIQCLLAELDIHKEKVEAVSEMYETKLKLYDDLCNIVDSEKILLDLSIIQEEVCSALLQLTHCKDTIENTRKTNFLPNICELLSHDSNIEENSMNANPELCSVIRNLHIALLKEDKVIESLAKASVKLPELCIEHPELKLSEYLLTDFLLKFNWKPEYFLNLEKHLKENSFVSRLLDNPIIIKEYKHEAKEDMEKFIQIAVVWNRCQCDYLLKIQALFFKEDNSIFAICPYVSGALLENPPVPIPMEGEKSCNILRQLLVCLKELHTQKLIYGAVHPSSILIENDKIVLDFCFNPGVLNENIVLKGINFHPPSEEVSEKSGDMYGFGCMVLWLLFPNLSFTSTEDGVPNVDAFRSIIEEALTTKDYAMLCSLLCSRQMARPSASFLLNKNFLSNYESYCRARNKAMSNS